MEAVVDGPRLTDLSALDGSEDAGIRSPQESLDELALGYRGDASTQAEYCTYLGKWVAARQDAEECPLRIKARMSTANRNAVDGTSPILRRRERINDSTNSNESASRSSQMGLGNVSHSRVNDGKARALQGTEM